MLKIVQAPIWRMVTGPRPGRQHLGYAPGGASDRWSFECGNRLLQQDPWQPAVEWSLAGITLLCEQPGQLVFTGSCGAITRAEQSLQRHRVYACARGDIFQVAPSTSGMRGYCCFSSAAANRVGQQRAAWDEVGTWAPDRGELRLVSGPEATEEVLARLVESPWQVSTQANAQGVRLLGQNLGLAAYDIRSAPVVDGLIQATAQGPIALLRDRQTIGGYPRVARIIETDIDLLAQFRPGQLIHFTVVEDQVERQVLNLRRSILANL